MSEHNAEEEYQKNLEPPLDEQLPEVEVAAPARASSKLVYVLYTSQFLTSWGDRLWQFAMPITLASIYKNTLFPVAFFQSFSFLLCALLGPHIGHFVDKYKRMLVASSALVIQNLCVALSAISMALLMALDSKVIDISQPRSNWDAYWPFSTWYAVVIFLMSLLFGGVSAVASMASQVSIMKDWAVVMSKSLKLNLAHVNATIRRIDLICNIVAPIVYSIFETLTSSYFGIILVTTWNLISFVPELLCLLFLHRRVPALTYPKDQQPLQEQESEPEPEQEENTHVGSLRKATGITVWLKGWKTYFSQMVLFASLSYVLLYTTVLNLGSIMVSFLVSDVAQMHTIGIAIFRALTAVTGVLATLIAPRLINRKGVAKSGIIGIWFQACWLYISLAFMGVFFLLPYFADMTQMTNFIISQVCLYCFVLCVVISRVGLWTFDLAETQIMQLGIQEDERGAVNTAEHSLTNVAEFLVLLMALAVARPEYFIILVVASIGCVQISAIIFTFWTRSKHRTKIDQLEEQEEQEEHDTQQDFDENELPDAIVADENTPTDKREHEEEL